MANLLDGKSPFKEEVQAYLRESGIEDSAAQIRWRGQPGCRQQALDLQVPVPVGALVR